MRGSSLLYVCIISSIAPSRISSVGMCGRKSLPTKQHMNTAVQHTGVKVSPYFGLLEVTEKSINRCKAGEVVIAHRIVPMRCV